MKQFAWLSLLGFGLLILHAPLDSLGQENAQVPKKTGDAPREQKITVGDWLHGSLRTDAPIDRKRNTFCNVFVITLEKGNYQIDMKADLAASPDLDSYLRLEDGSSDQGQEIDQDDDSAGGHDSRILFTCPKDQAKYRIIATTYDKNQTGAYFLRIMKMKEVGGGQDKLDHGKEITVNDPWHGTIRIDDQRDKVRGTRCNLCVITLQEGKEYQIDMMGYHQSGTYPQIDAYLRLEDSDHRHLDSNDDASLANTLNARITFPCKVTAKYRIIATTFDGATGDYGLQVTEMEADGYFGRALTDTDKNKAFADFKKAIGLYALQGKADSAIAALQKAIDVGFRDFQSIESDRALDSLRNDPRFKDLRQKALK